MKMSLPLTVLLAVSGTALAGDSDAKDQPARFKITTKRKDDSVEVKAEKEKAVFAVKSPFGISQAVIERREDTWPKAVVLRLHLKGLSSFRASNGKVSTLPSAARTVFGVGPGVKVTADLRHAPPAGSSCASRLAASGPSHR
jgi:hypothetical protein